MFPGEVPDLLPDACPDPGSDASADPGPDPGPDPVADPGADPLAAPAADFIVVPGNIVETVPAVTTFKLTSLPDAAIPPKPTLRREWWLLAFSVLLLIAIVVPPLVNLGRYRHRIVDTISQSLGREVTMRAVSLRLLPMPALVLTDMEVSEQPGFGAEPALRAPSVIARIRLASLWRGRFEVSRVDIADASLNLVRNAEGRWNVGSILLQASHVANAPTGQRRAGPAPRFPYIEITDSRVNVKQGAEKLPYSLLNANVSMWLGEPDVWQIRLDGQPVRTDIELGLSDTGILRVQGSLHRATALGHMPLVLHGDWANAPLGQASRLLLGRDPGWRGDLHATGDVSGDLDDLAIKTRLTIANLHREEFSPPEPFAVDAGCQARYSRSSHALSGLLCRWPVGEGQLLLAGSMAAGGAESDRQATLALTAQQLPAGFLVALAGLARSDFAPAFHLEGALSGMLFYNAHTGSAPVVAGVVEAPQLKLVAAGLRVPLELTDTRLTASTAGPAGTSTLVLTTAPIDLGGPAPAVVDAQLTAQGFVLHASGSAAIGRLEELGRGSHLLPAALAWLAPQGAAEFDVTRSSGAQLDEQPAPVQVAAPAPQRARHRGRRGKLHTLPPAPSAPVTVAGTHGWLRLRNASYRPHFLPEAVMLPAVQAVFTPGQIAWSVPEAIFHQVPLQLSATYPLDCAGQPGCVTHFLAICTSLDGGALVSALLGAGEQGHLLDDIINRLNPGASRWPAMEGTIHSDTFTLGRLAMRNLDATLSIADGSVSLRSLDAQTLGGTLHSEGVIALERGLPRYDLTTTLTHAGATAAGALFHENWGAGTLSASSRLQLAGMRAEELALSARGTFHAEWSRGALAGPTPLAHFALWTADGRVQDQALILTTGQLTPSPASAPLPVTGSISFERTLSLQIAPGPSDSILAPAGPASAPGADPLTSKNAPVTVTGTLTKPIR